MLKFQTNCALDDASLWQLLQEDVPYGDLTTASLPLQGQPGRLTFKARSAMTLCGSEEAMRLLQLVGADVVLHSASGSQLPADALILEAQGPVPALHHAWKVAQNLVEWASGMASVASAMVAAATPVAVACTRKSVPGVKAMSVKAVRAGGARMHRLGLSESLLIFAEHRLYLDMPPAQTVALLKQQEPEKKVVVEVSNIAEALSWAEAGADALQLEKFTPAQLEQLLIELDQQLHTQHDSPLNTERKPVAISTASQVRSLSPRRPLLIAAGGINCQNVADYVQAGAQLIVTSAPYSAPPRDVAVRFLLLD